MTGRNQRLTYATAALSGVAVVFACAPAIAQSEPANPPPVQTKPDATDSAVLTCSRARFALSSGTGATQDQLEDAEDTEAIGDTHLHTGAAVRHGPSADGIAANAETLAARHWMLGAWPTDTTNADVLWTGAAVVEQTSTPDDPGGPASVRTSGEFGVEAAQLTPLTGGKRVFALELAEGFTLAGVGSRRMWTERSRAVVLAAEAGWQLTPTAGLHLGYEVFQAPTGDVLPADAGGDSIFARFQLRF